MIPWLLREAEKDPDRIFMEKELLRQSKKNFEKAKSEGGLRFIHLDINDDYIPCPTPCPAPCSGMKLAPPPSNRKDLAAVAFCEIKDDVDFIHLAREDLAAYRFNLEPVMEKIRKANGLEGSKYSMTPRLYFLGERLVAGVNTAFVLALFPDAATAEPHLLSLHARLPAQCSQTVIVTPSLDLCGEPLYPKLNGARLYPVKLTSSFGEQSYKISYLAALRRRLNAGVSAPPSPLTISQIADYEKYGYLCQDRLHIPGIRPRQRRNIVLLNGNEITIADALFALLMRFVVELKRGKGGWIAPADLVAGGFINDIEHRQRYSQLREHFKGSLKEKDGEKFIECDRSKGYRLSTHPDFVTYDKEKFKNHPEQRIAQLAKV